VTAVIVEYVGQRKMRIISSTKERREEVKNRIKIRKELTHGQNRIHVPMGAGRHWDCNEEPKHRCWKDRGRSKKNWGRHPHRIINTPPVKKIAAVIAAEFNKYVEILEWERQWYR
jgi:hypothetical protein